MTARLLVLSLAAALLLAAQAGAAWTVQHIEATGTPAEDLALRDGDRDGTPELYVATWTKMMRAAWDGSGWTMAAMTDRGARSVAVGDGDRDGLQEVYAGERNEVAQYVWHGDAWRRTVVHAVGPRDEIPALTLGDIEDDGQAEVYAGVSDGTLLKLFFKAGAWHRKTLGDAGGQPLSLWIGDGDRTGDRELYVATAAGEVRAVDRTAGAWAVSVLGDASRHENQWTKAVAVGDVDGNGLAEVYAGGDDGFVYRFAWTGAAWKRWKVASLADGINDLTVADVDGDGADELYAVAWDAKAHQVRGPSWTVTEVAATEAHGLMTVVAGDADRDGARELYATSFHSDQHPYGSLFRFSP